MQSQYPVAINATLTKSVKESIQIKSFIYHIIRKDADRPDYYDEVELGSEQSQFFEDRIKDACDGTQFIFTDPDENTCKADCLLLLEDPKKNLVPKSRELTKRFFDAHNRSMSDGVFIIAIISILLNDRRQNLLSFLKVDYSTVFQQQIKEIGGKKIIKLKRIMDSLADNKSTLQKWAIVDPSNLFAWDVLALQRGTTAEKKDSDNAISRYFKNFLQVAAKETSSFLTRNAVTETNKWARSLSYLPPNLARSDYKARAIYFFENNEEYDTEKFIDQVLGPYTTENLVAEEKTDRGELRKRHKEELLEMLAEAGIAGQKFESRPSSIPSNVKTTTMKTHTGVIIKFKGTQENNNISVKTEGNERIITIRTRQLDQD